MAKSLALRNTEEFIIQKTETPAEIGPGFYDVRLPFNNSNGDKPHH